MGTEERRARVLEAIVRDYVTTREPVGSRTLVERYNLGVSPATVRNDMSVLEEAGFIHQPHTSAGRIPTDQGYRQFVDSINGIKPLSLGERRAIKKLLDGAIDLDDAVYRAVRTLAQLTRQVAIVQYPSLQKVSLRHVELIPAGERHVILVIITEAGRVEQRTLVLHDNPSAEELRTIMQRLNAVLPGRRLSEMSQPLEQLAEELPHRAAMLVTRVGEAIVAALEADSEERVVMAGAGNLTRHSVDFSGSIFPLLDALEEQVVLIRLLTTMQEGMSVSIGEENHADEFSEASVVSTTYDVAKQSVGRIGVVGPTRMDYPATMAAVYAISRYLTDILSEDLSEK